QLQERRTIRYDPIDQPPRLRSAANCRQCVKMIAASCATSEGPVSADGKRGAQKRVSPPLKNAMGKIPLLGTAIALPLPAFGSSQNKGTLVSGLSNARWNVRRSGQRALLVHRFMSPVGDRNDFSNSSPPLRSFSFRWFARWVG